MSRVYVRSDVLTLPQNGRERAPAMLAPDAGNALEVLVSCGWEVVVLGRDPAPRMVPGSRLQEEDPCQHEPGAWLLTDQVADATWARPLGLRTAFVGPSDHEPARPQRCDFAFRDLRTAALEILATDAAQSPADH